MKNFKFTYRYADGNGTFSYTVEGKDMANALTYAGQADARFIDEFRSVTVEEV